MHFVVNSLYPISMSHKKSVYSKIEANLIFTKDMSDEFGKGIIRKILKYKSQRK